MPSDTFVKKSVPTAAMLNGQVLPVIRPFLGKFEQWNHKAAYLSALLLSGSMSSSELARRYIELDELAADVDRHFAQFREAVEALPYHARVEDLRAAFQRLRAMLVNAGAEPPSQRPSRPE